MGAEATCRVRGDLRCRVPFASITAIDVQDGRLTLQSTAGAVVLELGAPTAAKWADKIRSPKTVVQKLGLTPGSVVSTFGLADPAFLDGVPATKGRLKAGSTVVFLGVERLADLEKLRTLARSRAELHQGRADLRDTHGRTTQ